MTRKIVDFAKPSATTVENMAIFQPSAGPQSSQTCSSRSVRLDKYGDIFGEELGTIKSFCAELNVDPTIKPKFFKVRTVPFALRSAIEEELDCLEREGIVKKATHSEWATPIVAVPKSDRRVRLCRDFKVTINQALCVEQYPLPKVEDLLATLAGDRKFSKLDLTQAYLQLELQKYCTINSHRGLYQFKQLPFGIASVPALFQKSWIPS